MPSLTGLASELASQATELGGIIKALPDGPKKILLQRAYVDGLRAVWIFAVAVSAVAFLLSLAVKAYPMNVALVTDQGFEPSSRDLDRRIGLEDKQSGRKQSVRS